MGKCLPFFWIDLVYRVVTVATVTPDLLSNNVPRQDMEHPTTRHRGLRWLIYGYRWGPDIVVFFTGSVTVNRGPLVLRDKGGGATVGDWIC